MGEIVTRSGFSKSYQDNLFIDWYKLGQPPIADYWLKIPLDENGRRPSIESLKAWGKEWKEQAEQINLEIKDTFIEKTVAEKVEMLRRHSRDSQEIQNIALEYLRVNKDDLTPAAAVRLYQLGVDIERDSVGIPDALEKMSKLDDESLLSEISAIISDGKVDIEQIEE